LECEWEQGTWLKRENKINPPVAAMLEKLPRTIRNAWKDWKDVIDYRLPIWPAEFGRRLEGWGVSLTYVI